MDSDGSSSHVADRIVHWAPLRSWSLFSSTRARSRAPLERPSARTSHPRSLRNFRGDERAGRALEGPRSTERVRKGGEGRAGSRRDAHQRVREGGRHGGLLVNSDSSSLTMAGVENTRRRRVQGRNSEIVDSLSSSQTGRPGSTIAHYQQQHHHHHHHDHHHHHYHYHHHYHHFSRQSSGDQEQGTLMSATSTSTAAESLSRSASRNANQQRLAVNHRITNNARGPSNPREAAMEARDRLDERLRSAALLSHRQSNGLPGNFLDEFGFLFDDDEDPWSDDDIWEIGIQDWLAALGFEERWSPDFPSSSAQVSRSSGLSKAAIRRLHKEVFLPRGLTRDKETEDSKVDSSEQDDCSVCLEHFLSGQLLICLPCKHKFHPDCLSPWLESHRQCPYCRAKVSCEGTSEASCSRSGSGSGRGSSVSSDDDFMPLMEAVDFGISRFNVR